MSRKAIFVVNLKDEDRAYLNQHIRRGRASARSLTRARILLMADEGRSNKEIAEVLKTTEPTIIQIKKRYCREGLESAINEKPRSGAPAKIDGTIEAQVTLLACSEPPEGRSSWTLQLIADKLVELKAVDSISAMSIHRTLKKSETKPWQKVRWCIGKITSDYIMRMEDILDQYEQSYDPDHPLICMDEMPCQLIVDVLVPIPLNQEDLRGSIMNTNEMEPVVSSSPLTHMLE